MTKRQKQELNATMKINPSKEDELSIPFEETTATIESVRDLDTKHGNKTVTTLNDGKKSFDVFLNNMSINNLIDAYGDEDQEWIGKNVQVSKEKCERFDNEMIVLSKK